MSTMTIPRSLTRDDIAKILTDKLGSGVPVRPGQNPDSLHVGRLPLRAGVEVRADDEATTVSITPWGLTFIRIINSLGIVRKVEAALQ
jgi:hypothetical protein